MRRIIDHAAGGKLRDKNVEESWEIIEGLALYDNEILEVLAHAPMYNVILDKYGESLELEKIGLADGTKAYPVGIVREVEVYVGRLKLLEYFYVLDMEKDPTCPLLVGRGFLAIASTIIDCKKSKIAVGEGHTRDAELNPFKDVLVFKKMVEFLGAIPVNLKGNRWETVDMFDDDWCWKNYQKKEMARGTLR
ncbi:zinc finger, CCHC-type containing protein [Tanacetum coccineum]